jgi:hypothetical protein
MSIRRKMSIPQKMRVLYGFHVLAVVACSNKRETAVKETLLFAEQAPYTLAAPAARYEGFGIAVKDSALSSYNAIFKYFEPKDTTRARVYRNLPSELFFRLPVTHLDQLSSKTTTGDTLKVTAVYTRPNAKLFEKTLFDLVSSSDTTAPTRAQQQAFEAFVKRAKQELQDTDTAFFWVVEGPHIVRVKSASEARDSVTRKAASDAVMKVFAGLVSNAAFSELAVKRYAYTPSDNVAGGINGFIDPGLQGWPTLPAEIYGDVHVACEARNREQAVGEVGYIILKNLSSHQRARVLCLWSGEQAQQWADIGPKSFRVRLVAATGRDSVVGPWTDINER